MATRSASAAVLFAVVAFASFGCTSPWTWNESAWWEEDESTAEGPSEETLAELRKKAKRVGDLTYPWNLNFLKVEGIALVTELDGTGSSPPADHMREALRKEMQTHKVSHPDKLLESDRTALVLVEGWLPPGARRGDYIDVKVVSPKGYETTSLAGGWMMASRLRPKSYLQGQTREGEVLANAEGSVLIDALFEIEPRDSQKLLGRVLGGGELVRDREIGLQIRSPDIRATHAMLVSKAINSRFSAVDGTRKVGASVAKDNKIISLNIPANYRGNLFRFLEVVAAIPVNENGAERTERLQLLAKQLLEPPTSGRAAIALEAAGKDAVALLEQGLASPRPEVAFYAAEALAYMDEKQGIETLRNTAKGEDRFRWHAIAALAAMTHIEAYEALSDLLQDENGKTRYGAFLALRMRNDQDPFIPGEKIRDEFHFHIVTSLGAPMLHFSRRQRAEIVVFGHDQRIDNLQKAIFLGKTSGIMLKPLPGGRVLVTRFAANKEDRRIETSGELVETMKAVIEVGGSYQELLTMAQALRDEKAWSGELVVDALPTPTRGSGYNVADANGPATPFPSLFDPAGDAIRRDAVTAEEFDPSSGELTSDDADESGIETAAGGESDWSWWPSWN